MIPIGDAIALAMARAFLLFGAACVALTLFCIYGIPWLWHAISPWLHSVTTP